MRLEKLLLCKIIEALMQRKIKVLYVEAGQRSSSSHGYEAILFGVGFSIQSSFVYEYL